MHDVCATGEAAARACAGGASPPAPEPPPTHPRPRPPASHTTVQAGSAGPHQADVAIDAAAAAPLDPDAIAAAAAVREFNDWAASHSEELKHMPEPDAKLALIKEYNR